MRRISFFLALLLVFIGIQRLSAQSFQAQVSGVITDQLGARVAGAEVHAIDQQKGTDNMTKTDEKGAYLFPSLLPSSYTITCEVKGYKQYREAGIVLEVDQKLQLDIMLDVGSVEESVVVNAASNGLDTVDASIGLVVTSQQIDELPLDVRDPFGLVALMPGAVLGPDFGNGGSATQGRNFFKSNFNVGGGKSGSQAILIDGAPNTTADISRAIINPPLDGVQEFKVQAISYDARYGRTSGAVLNMLTRSGTNQIHGALYDFERDSAFDAQNYFPSGDVPAYHRRQVGGAVGFPVLRDRWFGFLDTEILRQAIPESSLGSVPSLAERQGDFSNTFYKSTGTPSAFLPVKIYDPSTYSSSTGKRTQFMGCDGTHPNVICLANLPPAVNQLTAKILSYYPQPNLPSDPTNVSNFVYSANTITHSYKFDIRNDFNLGKKTTLFGRFSRQHDDRVIPGALPPDDAGTITADTYTQVVIGLSRVISPSILASLTTSFSRGLAIQSGGLAPVSLADFGFSANFASEAAPQLPLFSMTDVTDLTLKSSVGQQHQPRNTYATIGQLSYLHGKHSLSFGGEWWILDFNEYQNSNSSGTLKFDHSFTQQSPISGTTQSQGADIADLLLGIPSGINQVSNGAGSSITKVQAISTRGLYYAAYVQDFYRLTDRLTLDMGLRWDVNIGDREKYNRLAWFDQDAPSPLGPTIGIPTLKGVVRWVGNGNDIDQQATAWKGFNPRFGYAFQLNKKTVLRGGYGIFFTPRSVQGSGQGAIGTTVTTQVPVDGLTPTTSILDPFPLGVNMPNNNRSPIAQAGSTMSIPTHDFKAGYVQMFSFDIQRQVPWGILLDVYYWANMGTHIATQTELNELPKQYFTGSDADITANLTAKVANPLFGIIPGQPAQVTRRQTLLPYPQYQGDSGLVQVLEPVGKTNYNAVTAIAQKRLSNSLSFTAQYTWGKAMDNLNTPLDATNRAAEYSTSDLDVTNQFISSFVGQLPYGHGRRYGARSGKWVNAFLGGWNVNGIVKIQSGFPVSVTRPSVLIPGANPHLNHPTVQEWFDTSAIQTITSNTYGFSRYSFGNIGHHLPHVRTDGIRNLDAVVEKVFKGNLYGRPLSTQFRAEAYNVLNHPYFGAPNGTNTSIMFGQVTTQLNQPRDFQFGIKVKF